LRASHEEAESPNGREDHEVHLVVSLVSPDNSLGLGKSIRTSNISSGTDAQESNEPNYEEG
jgi:hypothetical protein